MKFFYLGIFSLCLFLAGCEKPEDEMENLDLMVQVDDEEGPGWSLPDNKIIGQEMPVFEGSSEDVR